MPTEAIGNWPLLKLIWKARLPRGAERVLIGLLAYGAADSDGCYPSLAALADLLAMDRRNVMRGMKYLVKHSLITRTMFAPDSARPYRQVARSVLNLGAIQSLGAKAPLGANGACARGERRLLVGAPQHPKETIGEETTKEETKYPPTPQRGAPPKPAKKSSKSVPPYEEIRTAWNAEVKLPACRLMTDDRKRALAARWQEPEFRAQWRESLQALGASAFHTGDNDRGWRAGMDFWLRPGRWNQILEQRADGRKPKLDIDPQGDASNAKYLKYLDEV